MRVSRTKERKIRQKWLDGVRKELREREKNQKPKPDLALKPPVLVNDPQTRRLARLAIANEKRLERLDGRHHGEAVKMLQKFEQELAEKANDLGSKAAEQEKHRGREQEKHRSKADDFDRFR